MTSPTIIQQPGAIDQAAGAFMQSYAMSRGLAQKRQELELERQKVVSQTNLEGAQASEARDRAKKLEQEIEDTQNMQIGLRFAQAHLNNLDDDQAFAADTKGLDEVQRGYAMSARDVLRQTRADIASKQQSAAMQQQEALKMQADRERQSRIDAGIGDVLRSHQGQLNTIEGVQSAISDAAVVDPESAKRLADTFLPQLEGNWQPVHGDNGQLILVDQKKGTVRNTGINLGPRVAGGAAGSAVSKEEAIAALRTAIHAIDQIADATRRDDNADVNPVVSAMVGGAGHIPVVGGAVSGATRPISQLLKSDAQQQYSMLAQQLLHNQASLMPRGQRSMPLLQSLMDGYIPPAGSSKATRYAARRDRQLLRRTYVNMLNEFLQGKTPDFTLLPGYKEDAQAAASEPTAAGSAAPAPGALNYGDFRRGPQ